MARTAIPVQTAARYGGGVDDVAFTAGDAANDHEFENNGKALLLMKNGSGSSKSAAVVGVANARTWNNAPSVPITCDAGEQCLYGPFSPSAFNQADGKVHVDLTDDTSVEFAVVELQDSPQ